MRKCVRCGANAVFFAAASRRKNVATLPTRPRSVRMAAIDPIRGGTTVPLELPLAKVALCPRCGEISVYADEEQLEKFKK